MKSINQFDYPSKDAQSFKANSQLSDSLQNKDLIKARYKQNLQYHMQLERNKVKQTQIIKKQQESKRKKQRLESQLEKKKRQLENLQILKVQAQQNQKKAYELAALKQEQDIIKRQQEKRRKLQFDEDASIRFSQAMKKLHEEKQEQSFKQRLAEQRRKTAQQFQKLQRIKAEKFRQLNQQKQRIKEKENNSSEEYKKTFKQFFTNPNQDYNRTCVHNLKVVSEIKKEQQNAIEKGKLQQGETRERSQQKRRRAQQNDRRSKERGREALIKIQREREYESFEKETTEEQKRYNLQRIEAGKRNQFIGVKPTTLSQMQTGKKMRSEEQFDKMFFSKSVQPSESANRTATKFQIVEKRIPRRNDDEQEDEVPRKIKSYLKQKQQSEIPAVSQGKYSFEEKSYSDFKNHSRSQSNIHSKVQQNQQQNDQEQQNQQVYAQSNIKSNALKETRIPGYEKTKDELPNYKNIEGKEPKLQSSFKKQPSKQKPKLQEEPFDTNAMLKKYGLHKETLNDKAKPQAKSQSKRKVVQLSNVCQNKQAEKQELNYSSESQEDSLS